MGRGRRKSKSSGALQNPGIHEENRSVVLAAAAAAQERLLTDLCPGSYCSTCRSRGGDCGGGPCRWRGNTPDQLSAPSRGGATDSSGMVAPSRGGATDSSGMVAPSRGGATDSSGMVAPSRGSVVPSRGDAARNPYQDHGAVPPSTWTQPQPSVSYSRNLLGTTTFKDTATSSSSPQAEAETPPPKPTIYVNKPPDWYFKFYIRIDRLGYHHTYPHLGGPFKSPQEVEKAVERYLHDKTHKTLWKEQAGDSRTDTFINKMLYWPDGTTRKYSDKQVMEHTREQVSLMLQALLDKYSEDSELVEDFAYEFKDVLHYQTIYEDYKLYKHFNFTAKTKDGIEDLFFAEVKVEKDNELVLNCFCKIESNENGHCYGCINHGTIDMKHPDKAGAYSGGHLNVYLPCGRRSRPNTWTGSKEDVAAEEARLRRIYCL